MKSKFLIPALAFILMASCSTQSKCSGERIIYNDTLTGNEIWQVSQGDSMSLMPYFEAQAFTFDDKYAIFKSKREGGWKLFATALADGRVHKVSDRIVDGSYSVFATGNEVIFLDGGVLYAVNVEDMTERVLFDANGKVDEDVISFNSSFTSDGEFTVLKGTNADRSASIYRVHIPSQRIERVGYSAGGLDHPLINPVYADYITYVCKPDIRAQFELPREQRARGMLIRVDTKEVRPFVMSDKYYRATHETWSKDGERFFYFDKLLRSLRGDGGKGGEVSVVSLNKDGGDRTVHHGNSAFKLGHGIASANGRFFIADVQQPMKNPLFLINLLTGEAEIICWADQSMLSIKNTQHEHVHPLFSQSGKYVAFTSDRNSRGVPQAFIVPMEKILKRYE